MKEYYKSSLTSTRTWGTFFLLVIVFLTGCGNRSVSDEVKETDKESTSVHVVTTFYPMYEFASQVMGENGVVTVLLEAGQDTHNYEPSPKDMAAIFDADVFIYSSEYMETWIPAVLDSLKESDVKIIEASKGIPFYEEEESEEGQGHNHVVDPHVWLDPNYASQMVGVIAEELQDLDKEHAGIYKENAENYQKQLRTLDKEFKDAFNGATNRTFVVQHAAFGYLARRYDLQEVSISSLTSEQEISPAKLAEIGKFIKANNVQTIYYQDSGSAKVAETLARETNTELKILYPVEGITEADQKEGIDYISLMRKNLQALQTTIK